MHINVLVSQGRGELAIVKKVVADDRSSHEPFPSLLSQIAGFALRCCIVPGMWRHWRQTRYASERMFPPWRHRPGVQGGIKGGRSSQADFDMSRLRGLREYH
jgi:hypothetical protein